MSGAPTPALRGTRLGARSPRRSPRGPFSQPLGGAPRAGAASRPGARHSPRLLRDAPEPSWCPPASAPRSPSATPPRLGRPRGPRTPWDPIPRCLSAGRGAPLQTPLRHPPPEPGSPMRASPRRPCAPATYTGGSQRLPAQGRLQRGEQRARSLARHAGFFLALQDAGPSPETPRSPQPGSPFLPPPLGAALSFPVTQVPPRLAGKEKRRGDRELLPDRA